MRTFTPVAILLAATILLGGCAGPVIDGKIDAGEWAGARAIEMSKLEDGAKASVKTTAHILCDGTTLFVAIECFDDAKALGSLVADVAEHDYDNIWQDDEVEVFVDPTNQRKSYYQIIVNYKGVTWDAYHGQANDADMSWEPKYQIATAVGEKSWVMELALPISAFDRTDKTADTWAVNLLRNRTASSELIYSTPTETNSSHSPEKFGQLDKMPVIQLKK